MRLDRFAAERWALYGTSSILMDDSDYKRLCAQPDVMRRSEIRAAAILIRPNHPDLASRLTTLLGTPPLPKPSGHQGGPDSDHLHLELDSDELELIVDALGDQEVSLSDAGEPAPSISQVGTLLDRSNQADSSRAAV